MFYKKILNFKFLIILLGTLFLGCSQKEPIYEPINIDTIYKPINSSHIKNSKNMHRATLKPYVVFGKKYYPFIAGIGDQFIGIASWYGPKFHAKKTSNGEIYNMHAMTAAHKTLPMNTMLEVLNLENHKSIIVRVNDRGPFIDGRIIDLSNKAAHKIDMVRKGTVKVRITVLGYNAQINNNDILVQALNGSINKQSENYYLQVAAFSDKQRAKRSKNNYELMTSKQNVIIKKFFSNNIYLYKVFITGFNSHSEAIYFKEENALNDALILKE